MQCKTCRVCFSFLLEANKKSGGMQDPPQVFSGSAQSLTKHDPGSMLVCTDPAQPGPGPASLQVLL